MVLWVNLHGSFLIGFLLIGLYWASSGVEWWRASPEQRSGWRSKLAVLLVLALACGCATLVNPNGWNLHRHIGRFLGSAYQLEYTDEWRAANFHAAGMRGFLGQLLLIGIVLLARQSSWAAVDVLLVGVCGYCGLYSVRNIPVFAIVVTPILAEHLGAVLCGMKTSRWGRRCQGISERITAVQRQSQGLMVGLGCVLVGVLVLATPRLLGGLAIIETELLADRFPVEAVRYLQSHAAAVEGNVFNEYNWGGYLMRYLPAKKLFIDSRNDFYGETLLKDFDEVDELKPGWQQILQKYDVRWTLLSVNHPLSNVLALREDWVLLYRDKVACIHVRR
jgi:hypothetical protein